MYFNIILTFTPKTSKCSIPMFRISKAFYPPRPSHLRLFEHLSNDYGRSQWPQTVRSNPTGGRDVFVL